MWRSKKDQVIAVKEKLQDSYSPKPIIKEIKMKVKPNITK